MLEFPYGLIVERLSWRRDLALTASFAGRRGAEDDESVGYRFMER
jgi:hypothetical protein